jgi:two-component sensor histidine kinase
VTVPSLTRWLQRYRMVGWLVGAATLALAFGLRAALDIVTPYITFFPAVVVVTFLSGRLAGLAVSAVATVVGWYFFIPPLGFAGEPRAPLSALAFFAVAALIVVIVGALREALIALDARTREAEAARGEIETLLREMGHRARNDYTLVDAIVRSSWANLPHGREVARRTSERLRGLSRSHDLLLAGKGESADLGELIVSQLQPFCPAERVALEGPAVRLSPAATRYVGLALHELASNATKYGALRVGDGGIAIGWRIDGGQFCLLWSEPVPAEAPTPRGSGFGTRLLNQVVPQALGGSASLDLADSVLRWELRAPLDAVSATAPAN